MANPTIPMVSYGGTLIRKTRSNLHFQYKYVKGNPSYKVTKLLQYDTK